MTIIPRTQEALKAYVESLEIAGLNVYRGMGAEIAAINTTTPSKVTNPCIVCECRTARHNQSLKGNWLVQAGVVLRLNAPDVSEDDVRTWCGTLSEHFETGSLAPDISEAAPTGYTALGVELQDAGYRLSGKVWEIYLTMEIHCAPLTCPDSLTLGVWVYGSNGHANNSWNFPGWRNATNLNH